MSAIEIIPAREIPQDVRISEKYSQVYRLASKLKGLGDGVAIRVKLDAGAKVHLIQKKTHAHFRRDSRKLKTRQRNGYLYLWLEMPQAQRFDLVDLSEVTL